MTLSKGWNSPIPRWLAGSISLVLFVAVAVADYLTGRSISFTLLFLIPISMACWFAGRRAGVALAVCAAIVSSIIEYNAGGMLAVSLWNAGVKFGVYLSFCTLLNYLKTHHLGHSVLVTVNRIAVMTVLCAVALAAVGGVLQKEFPALAAPGAPNRRH